MMARPAGAPRMQEGAPAGGSSGPSPGFSSGSSPGFSSGSSTSSATFSAGSDAIVRRPPTPAAAAAKMRVITRDGCPRLGDLVGLGAEVWSGRRWITVHVGEADPPSKFLRIRLDDGSCLTTADDHHWAVVSGGRLAPTRAGALHTDDEISPFHRCPLEDLGGEPAPGAYAEGEELGHRFARSTTKPVGGLPAHVFAMDPASLGLFVSGWMDAQGGVLFGDRETIHDLHLAVARLGISQARAEYTGGGAVLTLEPAATACIPNPRGSTRTRLPPNPARPSRAPAPPPRVVEIFRTPHGRRQKACTVTSEDPRACTIVLNGILTMC